MTENWTQETSQLYRQLARIAVPSRKEQLSILLTLVPFVQTGEFTIVELASGEGFLSHALAEAFPHASILALDYEESMCRATSERLSAYQDRVKVDFFDILTDDWFGHLSGVDLVISSLCIHHLDDAGKQRLFNVIHEKLSDQGVFLIADLVAPRTPQAQQLFAETWDRIAEAASIEFQLSRDLFQIFQQEKWNIYHYPDDFDKPSPLYEQLGWLKLAGFLEVDCFWMRAGHAIYGAYKRNREGGIPFQLAETIAEKVLSRI